MLYGECNSYLNLDDEIAKQNSPSSNVCIILFLFLSWTFEIQLERGFQLGEGGVGNVRHFHKTHLNIKVNEKGPGVGGGEYAKLPIQCFLFKLL